jgi:hypothetical protein
VESRTGYDIRSVTQRSNDPRQKRWVVLAISVDANDSLPIAISFCNELEGCARRRSVALVVFESEHIVGIPRRDLFRAVARTVIRNEEKSDVSSAGVSYALENPSDFFPFVVHWHEHRYLAAVVTDFDC